MAEELVEVEGLYRTHTDKAIRIAVDRGGRLGRCSPWIPKSQIEDYAGFEDLEECSDLEDGDPVSLFIPQWLAEEKGLV